jgi:CRP-like cAMP-binding protein
MKTLTDHILKTVSIPDSELTTIVRSFQPKALEKDSYLIREGQYCDKYYFVAQGALRIYTRINDAEITSWFALKDYFFTELESYPVWASVGMVATAIIGFVFYKEPVTAIKIISMIVILVGITGLNWKTR